MSLTYLIDSTQRVITINGDCAERAGWNILLGRILNDPLHQTGFGFLRDLRDSKILLDDEHLISILDVVRHFWPLLRPSRAAVVLPRSIDVDSLTAAQMITASEHWPLGVFLSYQEAMDWLRQNELPDPEPQEVELGTS
jgi:hypothetical protein